jgi:hypothetical protein
VRHCYQYVPSGARNLLFLNLPMQLAKRGLVNEVLRLAGYSVDVPPSSSFAPPPPPSGHVTLLRLRYGATSSGEPNQSIIVATVLPPADDPHLRDLPPAFFLLDWPVPILALLENDKLERVRVRRPPSSSPSLFPTHIGAGWTGSSEIDPMDYVTEDELLGTVPQASDGRPTAPTADSAGQRSNGHTPASPRKGESDGHTPASPRKGESDGHTPGSPRIGNSDGHTPGRPREGAAAHTRRPSEAPGSWRHPPLPPEDDPFLPGPPSALLHPGARPLSPPSSTASASAPPNVDSMVARHAQWTASRARASGFGPAAAAPTASAPSPTNRQAVGTVASAGAPQSVDDTAPPSPSRPRQPSDPGSPSSTSRRQSETTDPYVATFRKNRREYRQLQLETWGADDRAGEYFNRVRSEGGGSAGGTARGHPRRRTEPPPPAHTACPTAGKRGRPRQRPPAPDRPCRHRRPPQPYWLATPPPLPLHPEEGGLPPPVAHSPKNPSSHDASPSLNRSRSRSPDQRVPAPRRSPVGAGRSK